jgi:hypothetical protein
MGCKAGLFGEQRLKLIGVNVANSVNDHFLTAPNIVKRHAIGIVHVKRNGNILDPVRFLAELEIQGVIIIRTDNKILRAGHGGEFVTAKLFKNDPADLMIIQHRLIPCVVRWFEDSDEIRDGQCNYSLLVITKCYNSGRIDS